MCEDLTSWRYNELRPNRRKRKPVAILIKPDDDDRLLAWALIVPAESKGYEAQFYTRKTERGKGLGSILMEKTLEIDPKPYVYPHDVPSGAFFKKHRDTIRFDKYDTRWLD